MYHRRHAVIGLDGIKANKPLWPNPEKTFAALSVFPSYVVANTIKK